MNITKKSAKEVQMITLGCTFCWRCRISKLKNKTNAQKEGITTQDFRANKLGQELDLFCFVLFVGPQKSEIN